MIDDRILPLDSSLVLVSCEGGFENTVLGMLLKHDLLVFDKENVIGITSTRSARQIELKYLGFDYGDKTLSIVRILDSRNETFRLGSLYRDRFPVFDICTCPEIEILSVIKEEAWDEYAKVSSRMKPSEFCAQKLKLHRIKSPDFLMDYWDIETLVNCILTYQRLHNFKRNELSFAHLLR